MTRLEHLLAILAEECLETGQRATKALRFTLEEIQPTHGDDNAYRIIQEYFDIRATISMLCDESPTFKASLAKAEVNFDRLCTIKREKIEKFLLLSEALGTLS